MRTATKVLLLRAQPSLSDVLLDTFGSSLLQYLRINDASGAAAVDSSGNGRNGAYVATTLAQPGLGDGLTSGLFDQSTSRVNAFSTSLNTAFNGGSFSFLCFFKPTAAGVWTDSTARRFWYFRADASNYFIVQRHTTNNWIQWTYIAGGTSYTTTRVSCRLAAWTMIGASVSNAGSVVHPYYQCVREQIPLPTVTSFSGSLITGNALIFGDGAANASSYGAHAAVIDGPVTPDQMWAIGQRVNVHAPARVTAMGDSKTAGKSWVLTLLDGLTTASGMTWDELPGRIAASGRTTQDAYNNFAAEVTPIVGPAPHWVFVNLGVNNLSSLPSEANFTTWYGGLLDAIHAKWPNAQIGYVLVWGRTYDANADTLDGWITSIVAGRSYCTLLFDERIVLKAEDDGAAATTDGIHPTEATYAAEAALIQTAMGY